MHYEKMYLLLQPNPTRFFFNTLINNYVLNIIWFGLHYCICRIQGSSLLPKFHPFRYLTFLPNNKKQLKLYKELGMPFRNPIKAMWQAVVLGPVVCKTIQGMNNVILKWSLMDGNIYILDS